MSSHQSIHGKKNHSSVGCALLKIFADALVNRELTLRKEKPRAGHRGACGQLGGKEKNRSFVKY